MVNKKFVFGLIVLIICASILLLSPLGDAKVVGTKVFKNSEIKEFKTEIKGPRPTLEIEVMNRTPLRGPTEFRGLYLLINEGEATGVFDVTIYANESIVYVYNDFPYEMIGIATPGSPFKTQVVLDPWDYPAKGYYVIPVAYLGSKPKHYGSTIFVQETHYPEINKNASLIGWAFCTTNWCPE
ncbi:MAG: hypothetical protein ACP5JY_01625 [Candidatus Nanoarchaeia archaeon]